MSALCQQLASSEFWIGVVQTLVGILSFASVVAFLEWRHTTKRLKKYVTQYVESVEFEWSNQTRKFAVMHRVRAFEILLRHVEALRPRTPGAYKRVEEVRDAVEYFHRTIPIFRGEHLPLPRLGEFPLPPDERFEAQLRGDVLEKLRSIKWLGLKESSKQ